MSIRITYRRLFQLSVRHNYFSDENEEQIVLTPSAGTQSKMRGGRMLMKRIRNQYFVSYYAGQDGVTPLVNLGQNLILEFLILVKAKSEFIKRSNLDDGVKSFIGSSFVLFENDPASASTDETNPEVITHRVLDGVRPRLFTFDLHITAPPPTVDFTVRDANGNAVSVGFENDGTPLPTTITLTPNADGNISQQIDLRSLAEGVYEITVNQGLTIFHQSEIYVSNDYTANQDLLGVLRLNYDDVTAHLYGNTEHYAMQFIRKETLWKYLVVNQNGEVDMTTHTLTIVNGSGAVSPYPNASFNPVGAIPHPDIAVNGNQTAVFISDQSLPYFENPLLSLSLLKQQGANPVEQVIQHLPNPTRHVALTGSAPNEESEIYVFI